MINKKQEERLDYLLEAFKKDSLWYKDLEVGILFGTRIWRLERIIRRSGELSDP